jgi:hypothetical protein
LDKANERMDQEATDLSKKMNRHWQRGVLEQLLRREAEDLLGLFGGAGSKTREN